MLNKTNILVIFILFTIGCVNLPETTAENVEDSPTATIDIDATVMAMFEASNSNETVKKDPSADTQLNITSANAEQAVSVNTEATIEALRKELLGEIAVTPAAVAQTMPTSTTEPISTSAPTATLWIPTLQPTPRIPRAPQIKIEASGGWYSSLSSKSKKSDCYDMTIINIENEPISIELSYHAIDDSGIRWGTSSGRYRYLGPGDRILNKICLGDSQATQITQPNIDTISYVDFHKAVKTSNPSLSADDDLNATWYNLYDSSSPHANSITVTDSPDLTPNSDYNGFFHWIMTNNSSDTLLVKPCLKVFWKALSDYSSQDQASISGITTKTSNLGPNVLSTGYHCGLGKLEPYSGKMIQGFASWDAPYEVKLELQGIWVAKID